MSISEIILILVIALLVIKPEQLPNVAFKLGKWSKYLREALAKLRREWNDVANPLTPEQQLLKNELNNES